MKKIILTMALIAMIIPNSAMAVVTVGDIQRLDLSQITLDGTVVTASGSELNIMDGVTSTTAELNYLDLTALGTGEVSKALVLDGSGDLTYPSTGTIVYPASATLTLDASSVFSLYGTSVTSTGAELNLLDGSVEANTVASVAPILDTAKALQTNANVGAAGSNVTAVEYGDGYNHVTVLTLTASPLTPTTIPADAEGAGVIIYTFPAGVHLFTGCHMDITAFTGTGFAATNAVDIGIGSFISSGDIATLTTATMEDCVTGQTIADISSPAKEKSTIATAGSPLLFESGDSKVIHLNVAGTWNDTFTAPIVTGTITLYWTFLGA